MDKNLIKGIFVRRPNKKLSMKLNSFEPLTEILSLPSFSALLKDPTVPAIAQAQDLSLIHI